MMNGIRYMENFLDKPDALFALLEANVIWDSQMAVRKTASYGAAYNYSQITYPYKPLPTWLFELCKQLNPVIGFTPNNCLVNYYADGHSKMGFHADDINLLAPVTGIAIVSVGDTRVLRSGKRATTPI